MLLKTYQQLTLFYRFNFVFFQGYTFPTTSEENLGPIHLLNLSNKVQQISYDKGTGALTYSLTPRFDASDIVPWYSFFLMSVW